MSTIKCNPFRIEETNLEEVFIKLSEQKFRDIDRERAFEFRPLPELKKQYQIMHFNTESEIEVEYFPVEFMWESKRRDADGNWHPVENFVTVLFFEKSNSVFAILKCGNDSGIRRFGILLEKAFDNVVQFPEEFRVSPDFFKWLLYRFDLERGFINKTLKLLHLSDYLGQSEDEVSTIKGKGLTVLNLFASKATLFSQENIRMLKIFLAHNNNECDFVLSHDGVLSILTNEYYGDFFEHESHIIKENLSIYYTFYTVIPILKAAYKNDSTWTQVRKDFFERKLGLELMSTIVKNLNIDQTKTIEDILSDIAKCSSGQSA